MKKDNKNSQLNSTTTELAEKSTNKRRKFLAGITTGAAAAGIASNGNWVKPVVDSVVLPVHAQTSSEPALLEAMTILGRIGENTDTDEFNAYEGTDFTDGNYPIGGDYNTSFNNFNPTFNALFQPVQGQAVTVNLDVNMDLSGAGDTNFNGSTSQSEIVAADAPMQSSFTDLGVGASGLSADSVITVVGTIQAGGYTSRRITYVITPA